MSSSRALATLFARLAEAQARHARPSVTETQQHRESGTNPMRRLLPPRNTPRFGDLSLAPRCAARCKRGGGPCRQPALRGKRVCRMHGGTAGAPRGERNGAWHVGCRDTELRDARAEARAVWHHARAVVRQREAILRRRALRQRLVELAGPYPWLLPRR